MAKKTTENKKDNPKHTEKQTVKQDKQTKESKKQTHKTNKKESDQADLLIQQQEKIAELQDKYVRLSAEFDNYRKRTLKERADLLKSAGKETILKILPVLDDFDRAMHSTLEAKDIEAVKKGIELIYNKFHDTMKQLGLKEIEARNTSFDTDLHEAITKIPAPEDELRGKVVDVIEKGYYLNEKVIRYSKVVIGE